MYSYPYENAYIEDRPHPSFNRRGGPIVNVGNQTGEAPSSYVHFQAIGKPKDGYAIRRLTQSTFQRYRATNVRFTFTVYKHRSRANIGSKSWQKQTDGGWVRSIGGGALSLKVKLLDSNPPLDTSTQLGKNAVKAMLATAKVVASSLPKNRSVKITVGTKVHDGYKTPVAVRPMGHYGADAPRFDTKVATSVLLLGVAGIAGAYALGVSSGSTGSKRGSRAKHTNKQRAAIGAGMGALILGSPGAAAGAAIAANKGTKGGAAGSAFAGSLVGGVPRTVVLSRYTNEYMEAVSQGEAASDSPGGPQIELPTPPSLATILTLSAIRAAGAAGSAYYWTQE